MGSPDAEQAFSELRKKAAAARDLLLPAARPVLLSGSHEEASVCLS